MVRWKRSTPGVVTGSDHHDAALSTGAGVIRPKEEEGAWEAMYESLKRYREEHGHCQADQGASDTELGQWVMSQRRHYIAFAASTEGGNGDKKYNYTTSCMTQERVKKLKELGLDLVAPIVPPQDRTPTSTAAVKVEEDTREEAPTLSTVSTPNKRKKKGGSEPQSEPRRPPKKRKKSPGKELGAVHVPEERDAAPQETDVRAMSVERDTASGERDGVSPVRDRPIKGRGDSAWETLMNVAALVPPLPTPVTTETKKSVPALVAASPGSAAGSPQGKRVKSKYGDLEALSNAGESYSSKYRAANNDVVPNQQRWEDMFLRLGVFKDKHKHCRVPNRYPEDPSLGSWVATQRRYFKNKSLPMPEDRVRRLTDLGFEWTTKDPRKVPWETRFEGLKAFKEKFGHVDVPHEWEECPQLGFWTANMRQQYRYKQLGKKSSLTDKRIELLNTIGFVWKMQGGRRKKSDPVARPNQNTPPPPPAPTAQTIVPAATVRSLILDPMTSARAAAMNGISAAAAAAYIPPPSVVGLKHRAGSVHPMPYYSHATKL